ncbi:amidohydrolase [Laceyella putida]|uniref:Amidohydrolase n=1 Tax=Laceyella putida TaxID=110101 RepID=A0ABW2RJQ0_9BACL
MTDKTIYYHGRITTLNPAQPRAEALVVERGRIAAVGGTEQILLDHGRAHVNKVDLQGGYVYPGFIDSHLHLSGVGQRLRWLDLGPCQSKTEMLRAIKAQVAQAKEGEWILGMGWDEHRLHGGVPSLRELDEASPYHPVFLARVCFHAYLVNSAAYAAAGVTEGTDDPEDGLFGRDAAGRLNGWVYEQASQPFYGAHPVPSYQEKKETIRQAMRLALASGLTGGHSEDLRYIGNIAELIRIYRELVDEGVKFRTHHLLYHPYLNGLRELAAEELAPDPWFSLGAVKMFADGSIGGRTALLSEPYADDPHQVGVAIHELAELKELALQAASFGRPIAVHAIGDEAAARVIATMEQVPVQGNALRHRLIHGQFLRADLISRLQRLDVVVDIQPRFVASDFPWVLERVGERRITYAYAWKTLLQAGIPCAAGSDSPIEPLHPLLGLHAAVTRRRLEEPSDHPGYLPEQKLRPLEAMRLFTQGSAYAEGQENERGLIAVGRWADLTVYDRDILTCPAEEWLAAETLWTVVNGEVAYSGG